MRESRPTVNVDDNTGLSVRFTENPSSALRVSKSPLDPTRRAEPGGRVERKNKKKHKPPQSDSRGLRAVTHRAVVHVVGRSVCDKRLAMERGGGYDDDNEEPTLVIHHNGYTYEKAWASRKTLWTCERLGCGGQLSVIAVRSKRWRHRSVELYRDDRGGLTARKISRAHNHAAAAVGPGRTGGGTKMTYIEKKNVQKSKSLNHIVEKRVEDKNSKRTSFCKNINSSDTNVHCMDEKEDTHSITEHRNLFYDNIIEIPSVLNKIGSHAVENSKEKINKNISVCYTDVLKGTDKNKDDPNSNIESSNIQKTEPLQLLRCKQCNIYVVQTNYQQHLDKISHKIAKLYYESKNVQVINGHYENVILSTRIVSTCNSDSIHNFFDSIEVYVGDVIHHVIQLINGQIKIAIKMFALYQKTLNQNSDILGDVMMFMIKDEILTSKTVYWAWFKKVSNTFKLYNQNYLNIVYQKSDCLVRVMFLEIYFYKVPN